METAALFLFALFSCTYAQLMSTWGTSSGYSNQMQMPYGHMPYHHYGGFREAAVESVPYSPSVAAKPDAVMPIQIFRARIPPRVGLQDYSMVSVNPSDHEDVTEHYIYRQSMGDLRRPVMGVLSLLTSPMSMGSMGSMSPMNSMGSMGSMGGVGSKSSPGYQDSAADELMTCVGMDLNDQLKVHSTEPRIILNRGIPYYTQTAQKIKA